jgi:hypothetical protein
MVVVEQPSEGAPPIGKGPWITSPFSARQEVGSTFQPYAAADISMTRATAPARRSGSHMARTDEEPPVTWNPASEFA